MNNLDHSFDFLRCDWPGATLFSQQVHYVSGKFVTSLKNEKKQIILFFGSISEKETARLKYS